MSETRIGVQADLNTAPRMLSYVSKRKLSGGEVMMGEGHRTRWTLQHSSLAMLLLSGIMAYAQRSAAVQSSNQAVLNALAKPLAQNSFEPPLPLTYAAWSPAQRANAPRQIAGHCRVAWTMMNAGSKIQLLPAEQAATDTPSLVMGVCALGKMPQDWPGRPQQLAEVQRILRRSAELGEALVLPSSIIR